MIPVGTANELNHNMENIMNNIHMNQLCKVCNEPAAGFHFGAFTCEGCKSFFGRTYNNVSGVSECKNGGRCEITKKNRTSCKSCRLRKCLQVGMSKSGSRYGRRSNWFKIHCLLSAQSQSNGLSSAASTTSSASSPPETNNNNSSLLNNNNNSNNSIHNNNGNNSVGRCNSNNSNVSQSNSKGPSSTITSQGGQPTDIDREMMLRSSSSRHSLHHPGLHSNSNNHHLSHHHSSRERNSSASSTAGNNTNAQLPQHQQPPLSHRMGSNNTSAGGFGSIHPHVSPFPTHLPTSLSPNSKDAFLASFGGHIRANNTRGPNANTAMPNPEMYEYFRMAALAAQAAAVNGGIGVNNNIKSFYPQDHDSRDRDDEARPLTTRSPGSLESPNSESGSITDEIHKSTTPASLFGGILPPGSPHELKPNDLLSFDLITRDLMKLGYDPLRLWPAMLSASANLPPNSFHPQHPHAQFNPYRFMLPNFPGAAAAPGFPAHMLHANPLLSNTIPSSVVIPQPNIPPTSASTTVVPNGSLGTSSKRSNTSSPPTDRESPQPQTHYRSSTGHPPQHHNRRFPSIPIPTPLSGAGAPSSLTLTPPISHHRNSSHELMVPKFSTNHKSHHHKYTPTPAIPVMDDGPIDLSAKPNSGSGSSQHYHHHHRHRHQNREKRKISHFVHAESLVKSEIHSSDNDNNSSDMDNQVENEEDEEEAINFKHHSQSTPPSPLSTSSAASPNSCSPLTKKVKAKSDLNENQSKSVQNVGNGDDDADEEGGDAAAASNEPDLEDKNKNENDDENDDSDGEANHHNQLPHDLSRNSSPHQINNNNNNNIIKSECVNLAADSLLINSNQQKLHHRKRQRHHSCSSEDSETSAGSASSMKKYRDRAMPPATITTPLDLTRPASNSSSNSASSCTTGATTPSRPLNSNSNPPPKISI